MIEKYASLDWYRYPKVISDERLRIPPVVVWRFDPNRSNDELIRRIITVIRDVINSHQGNVSWAFEIMGKNWVVSPSRIQELEDSGQYRTDGEALLHLANPDPKFGMDAHAELLAIANEISRRLKIE